MDRKKAEHLSTTASHGDEAAGVELQRKWKSDAGGRWRSDSKAWPSRSLQPSSSSPDCHARFRNANTKLTAALQPTSTSEAATPVADADVPHGA